MSRGPNLNSKASCTTLVAVLTYPLNMTCQLLLVYVIHFTVVNSKLEDLQGVLLHSERVTKLPMMMMAN